MNPVVAHQPSSGRNVIHTFVVSAMVTAAFMLATANELGPFAPLVIAAAIYLASFAATAEAVLLSRHAWRAARSAIQRRRGSTSVGEGGLR